MPTNLRIHIPAFKDWLKTSTGKAPAWRKEREKRLAWYQKHLSEAEITLTRDDFATLVKSLWAVNIWQNKDYKVNQLIKDNGLETLRVSLGKLLHGSASIDKRWDEFRASVKGFGPSSLSEILTFFNPQEYALVNAKPYQVLPLLGFSICLVKNGSSYKKAVEEITKAKYLLEENGLRDTDFLATDLFIAYLFYQVFDLEDKPKGTPTDVTIQEESQKKTPKLMIDSHEGAEAVLLKLGNLLGYDTYTPDSGRTYQEQKLGGIATLKELPYFTSEKIMDSVQNIDVVWLKDEWPEYFFEVEHTTGVTPGLLRIYQAEKLNAKFFIIGPQGVLKRFEREIEKAPFNRIKEKYRFRSYEDLCDMHLATSNYRKISDQFLD